MTYLDALLVGFSSPAPRTEGRSLLDLQHALRQSIDPFDRGRLLAEIGALLASQRGEVIEGRTDPRHSRAR